MTRLTVHQRSAIHRDAYEDRRSGEAHYIFTFRAGLKDARLLMGRSVATGSSTRKRPIAVCPGAARLPDRHEAGRQGHLPRSESA
jgi:hypothetical protein